ncbi:MAG: hypothetical protein QM589_02990 [Thermomicrobiales bacterium]
MRTPPSRARLVAWCLLLALFAFSVPITAAQDASPVVETPAATDPPQAIETPIVEETPAAAFNAAAVVLTLNGSESSPVYLLPTGSMTAAISEGIIKFFSDVTCTQAAGFNPSNPWVISADGLASVAGTSISFQGWTAPGSSGTPTTTCRTVFITANPPTPTPTPGPWC